MRYFTRQSTLLATLSIGALAFGVSCASTQPSAQLEDARAQYFRAQEYHASKLDQVALHEAREALERAEQAHEEDPGSNQEINLAYIAQRRAQLAMARAGIAFAQNTVEESEQAIRERTENELEATKQAVEQTQETLAAQNEALTDARQQTAEAQAEKTEAQRRAEMAIDRLKDMAQVKEDSRDVVITLEGSLLFLTGKSDLLPIANQRLSEVAATLRDMEGNPQLKVVGHTDSRGSEEMNMDLSRRRAQSVADALSNNGIERHRIEVVAAGESSPTASNDTAQGRANNRRVEIIVVGSPPSQQGSSVTSPQTSPNPQP